jgi:UDP-N-acetylmuramoyl-L-alanyl-D-glutamate--2,6-diaminopimelate ligase
MINVDDPRGASLIEVVKRPVTYAINKTPTSRLARFRTRSPDSTSMSARRTGTVHVRSKLVGKPNVYNILGAVGTAVELGVPIEAIEEGLQQLPGVPGRFEVVSGAADDVTVVVDYAHTDDALRNLLETARPMATRRLITVFGAGGDRDRTKRPLMGMVAARIERRRW